MEENRSFQSNQEEISRNPESSPSEIKDEISRKKELSPGKNDRFLNAPLRYLLLFLFAIFFVILLYGGNEAQKTSNNEVKDWFPKTFPETQKLMFFKNHFGSSEMVLISWDGLTPEDPVQEVLAEEFLKSETDEKGAALPPLVGKVLTTKGILESWIR